MELDSPLESSSRLNVCVAGATGWTGRAVARAVMDDPGMRLVSSVSRSSAGVDLGVAWGEQPCGVNVHERVADALDGVDVLVDYTSHLAIRRHTMDAVDRGVHVVIGASGLTSADYTEIDEVARQRRVGVFAGGNFSLTAVLAQAAAALAAEHLPSWEIIDYASSGKPDAPSGTSRELAERLADVRVPTPGREVCASDGPPEVRGATVAGAKIHSVRLPGFDLATEVVFGLPHERLLIRHDSGSDASQFVSGTLLATRAVVSRVGLVRGLDELMLCG